MNCYVVYVTESIRRVEKIVGKEIASYSVDLLNKAALEGVFKKVGRHTWQTRLTVPLPVLSTVFCLDSFQKSSGLR